MGFDRAFAPGTRVPEALAMLGADLAARTPKAARQ
jgi:methylmalonyl-CoA mutase cobalamin-binding subunit